MILLFMNLETIEVKVRLPSFDHCPQENVLLFLPSLSIVFRLFPFFYSIINQLFIKFSLEMFTE